MPWSSEPQEAASSEPYDESNAAIAINLSPCEQGGDVAEATNIELKQTDDRPLVIL